MVRNFRRIMLHGELTNSCPRFTRIFIHAPERMPGS
jgi:hypothetical protein